MPPHDVITLGVPKAAATRSAPRIRTFRFKVITWSVLKRGPDGRSTTERPNQTRVRSTHV